MSFFKHRLVLLFLLYAFITAVVVDAGDVMAQADISGNDAERKKISVSPKEAVKSFMYKEDYFYDPAGKKDPFFPMVVDEKVASAVEGKEGIDTGEPPTPLEMFELSQLKLVAIMKFGDKDVAMVEDPEGKGHTLYIGTLIGKNKGRVLRMEEGIVLIEEKYRKSGKVISEIKELLIRTGEER